MTIFQNTCSCHDDFSKPYSCKDSLQHIFSFLPPSPKNHKNDKMMLNQNYVFCNKNVTVKIIYNDDTNLLLVSN